MSMGTEITRILRSEIRKEINLNNKLQDSRVKALASQAGRNVAEKVVHKFLGEPSEPTNFCSEPAPDRCGFDWTGPEISCANDKVDAFLTTAAKTHCRTKRAMAFRFRDRLNQLIVKG